MLFYSVKMSPLVASTDDPIMKIKIFTCHKSLIKHADRLEDFSLHKANCHNIIPPSITLSFEKPNFCPYTFSDTPIMKCKCIKSLIHDLRYSLLDQIEIEYEFSSYPVDYLPVGLLKSIVKLCGTLGSKLIKSRRISPSNLVRTIGRKIIDYDELEILIGLVFYTL